jgi:hypothetical protein
MPKDNRKSIIEKINSQTEYGYRTEKVEGEAFILNYSSSMKGWFAYSRPERIGETIDLDANQILCYMAIAELRAIAPGLPILPLYSSKFENTRSVLHA